jgi:hypothetical protein
MQCTHRDMKLHYLPQCYVHEHIHTTPVWKNIGHAKYRLLTLIKNHVFDETKTDVMIR